MDFETFIAMNGYGLYVWGSYGFAAIVLSVLVIATYVRAHEIKKDDENDA
ncbi:heme exporter protein CcmD [Micavibrio aeruginosavorus]|uniref:Heme exporter protein D n=1 Tax=Micavibrio aeruginosavorus (strain ARL-13) TaxID=856793 RepID=G2KSX8_MICAA|nr:heme exporter protein CcmD [Micavibrio aeruginosavorus]AEP10123.1 heme exporter protein CcmD [Micavibrio aeruginosavorus ARL-13]